MDNTSYFHLLTFATKYSRVPTEEIAKKRYYAVIETGKEPVVIDPQWYKLLIESFDKQAKKIWIRIIACTIIPDHVHIVIDGGEKNISEIVKKLKWYSSYIYNRTFNRKGPLRTAWYSDTYLDDENHLIQAIEYVRNNHFKHQEKRWNIWESNKSLKILFDDIKEKFYYGSME